MTDSTHLDALLRRMRDLAPGPAAGARAVPGGVRPLGLAQVDRALGGGLPTGRLHEVFARQAQDDASALGFTAMLARLIAGAQGREAGQGARAGNAVAERPVLWLREERAQSRAGLHGAGLADLGLDPARLLLGVLADARALLRAGVDALGCAALGAVILELHGNPAVLDLTASRRLALAAEALGVTPLLLRLADARALPSAAHSRWRVAAAPSAPLAADAPGHPVLELSLLRQRGGPAGFEWIVEWDRDAACFRPAAVPGARLPVSAGGSASPAHGRGGAGDAGWRIAV